LADLALYLPPGSLGRVDLHVRIVAVVLHGAWVGDVERCLGRLVVGSCLLRRILLEGGIGRMWLCARGGEALIHLVHRVGHDGLGVLGDVSAESVLVCAASVAVATVPSVALLVPAIAAALEAGVLGEAATVGVGDLALLVTHLPAGDATTVLAARLETCVLITPDDAVVDAAAANELERGGGHFGRVVLYEAEAARRLGLHVQAHDDALDGAHGGEHLLYLQLRGVEGQVAHIQRAGVLWTGKRGGR